MSDIGSIRAWIATYQNLDANRPVWVDMLKEDPTNYGVLVVPGKVEREDITGLVTVEYPFAFGATEYVADEHSTILNAEFYEEFAAWVEEQDDNKNLPALDAGKRAVSIEVLDAATMIERASETGIYQIPSKLTYERN